jgi:TRAP-type uncharacterized transport system fused permease subunit
LPAFVLPVMFVLEPAGVGLLLKGPVSEMALTVSTAILGIAALAAGVQNWLRQRLLPPERAGLLISGCLLLYPAPWSDGAGATLLGATAAWHWIRSRSTLAA